MKIEIEVYGVDSKGVYSTVRYTNEIDDLSIEEKKSKFKIEFEKIFLANLNTYDVATITIAVDEEMVFKDIVTTEKEYSVSVLNQGADTILELGHNFTVTKKHIVKKKR